MCALAANVAPQIGDQVILWPDFSFLATNGFHGAGRWYCTKFVEFEESHWGIQVQRSNVQGLMIWRSNDGCCSKQWGQGHYLSTYCPFVQRSASIVTASFSMAMMMLNGVGRGTGNLCGVRGNVWTRVSLTSTLTPTNFGESNAFRMLLELLTYMTRKQSCESSARVVAACVEH